MSPLLQHYVARQASARPDALAVSAPGQELRYGELDDLARRLAATLHEVGCRPGDRVGLVTPHSAVAVIGLLGIYEAGCVAVPLNEESPAPRLARALEASSPVCLLVAGANAELVSESIRAWGREEPMRIGWLDDESPAEHGLEPAFDIADVRRRSAGSLPDRDPGDVAHILFTSGSTGTPKGIAITHANVAHFVQWGVDHFGIGTDDRNSAHTPLYFDLSTFDLFATFAAGASLHMVPRQANLLPNRLAAFIRDQELTQWFSVPSALAYMHRLDAIGQDDFPSLRRLMWCGEVLPTPTLIYCMERLPHASFTNLYGPTETTIASSYHTVREVPSSDDADIPIGRACDGEELLLLDASLEPVAAGEVADLYIGGPGLSPGYWRDPERTKAAFIPHPGRAGERLYRTGDLAWRGDDGLLHFVGRADNQIKSRGYRIELGEVEQAVNALDRVAECAVVPVRTDEFEGTRICCAYVPMPDQEAPPSLLRKELRDLLPAYMLPSRWLRLERLPTLANGKTDRNRLAESFSADDEVEDASTAA